MPDLPPYVQFFDERSLSAATLEAIARGTYEVRGRPTELVPPVDWRMDPIDNHAWRFWFHTLQFLEYPLRLYRDRGDVDELRRGLALLLDWIAQNQPGSETEGDYAWYDMSVGVRAPFVAYLWLAARHEGLLAAEEDERLRAAIRQHAAWLMEEENYRPDSNHGLYEDAGLLLLATWARELPESEAWRDFVGARFLATLERHVQREEGLHLEHSPSYHFHVHELMARLYEATGIGGDRLAVLLNQMERVAPWLILPDGTQLPLGDTDPQPAAAWARALPVQHGMAALVRSGLVAVRHGEAHLSVTGAHHSSAHKHADELSWTLFEHGRLLVGEAGRYGHRSERDPHRVYARGAQGHNTLVVGGASFAWNGAPAYGTALTAAGAGGGWYAATGANPLVGAGIEHRRLVLYRPGHAVVVVDDLAWIGDAPPDALPPVERRVHAGPGLQARVRDGGFVLVDEEGAVLAEGRDWSATPLTDLVLAHGQEQPRHEGWRYPRDQQAEPVWTTVLHGPFPDAPLVHALSVAPRRLAGVSVAAGGAARVVHLDWGDGTETVRIAAVGPVLSVVAG